MAHDLRHLEAALHAELVSFPAAARKKGATGSHRGPQSPPEVCIRRPLSRSLRKTWLPATGSFCCVGQLCEGGLAKAAWSLWASQMLGSGLHLHKSAQTGNEITFQ